MQTFEVRTFDQWRAAARPLLTDATDPLEILWSDWRSPSVFGPGGTPDGATRGIAVTEESSMRQLPSEAPLLTSQPSPPAPARITETSNGRLGSAPPKLPRTLMQLLEELSYYRDAGRWELMYRLAWRVLTENHELLDNDADPDVQRARLWSKAIHRDIHKMHAFVRFHETTANDGSKRYLAWFEPAHEILRPVAPFFEKRFPNMHWMIATPDGAAVWNGQQTEFIESPGRTPVPREDETHPLWRTYYRNICNVARINPKVMQREMPQRYWRHLPEASEIDLLIRGGAEATHERIRSQPSPEDDRIPKAIARSLEQIAVPADSPLACRRCDLWRQATQAVLGEGPDNASIMLVGEQPGDEEDLRGRPFIGPAGQVLDQALSKAGLDRSSLFVTNAVKHFKWEPRGKRRLHKRPDQQEIRACGTWLEREIASVSPRIIVALGATAIRAVVGRSMPVETARQQMLTHPSGAAVVCTYHPSAVLRADDERRGFLLAALESDLKRASQPPGD